MEPDFQPAAEKPAETHTEQPKTPSAPAYNEALDIKENKDIAALSYLWILAVIVFFWKKESSFVRFHARQGIVLFVLSIVGFIIPFITQFMQLIVVIGSVWGFLLAGHGRREEVPFIGPLSRGKLSPRSSWKQFVAGVVHGSHKVKEMWNDDTHKQPSTAPAPTPEHAHTDTFGTPQESVYAQPPTDTPAPSGAPEPQQYHSQKPDGSAWQSPGN